MIISLLNITSLCVLFNTITHWYLYDNYLLVYIMMLRVKLSGMYYYEDVFG